MKKLKVIFLVLAMQVLVLSSYAQDHKFTIMCVAAHPDDEDGATLAYYSKLYGFDTYTVFYTRGEGGQNEIGPELYDELGKLREQECYDAANIQGSNAFFLGELDFGFSKTAKETFKFWGGKDSVLARIVYMIRVIKPDVIISNHDTITTKPNRQHGNHQAVGITIYEAFDKAADPTYHPEQLNDDIRPWQVKKLFFRDFDTTGTGDYYSVDITKTDATGRSIRDISYEALGKHKTQGMDKIPITSPFFFANRRYILVRKAGDYLQSGTDLFSGIGKLDGFDTKKKLELNSYATSYSYRTIKPEDSLLIKSRIKYNPAAYIGIVKTYDNTIENILQAFGIRYDTISADMLKNGDLGMFSTVILDLRAYLYRSDLVANNNKVLDYAYQGGNVLCFYNKPAEWKETYAPYPIYLTNLRVTEEDAPVKIIGQGNYLLTRPNEITGNDFNGWVQERNVYLPLTTMDDTTSSSGKYKELLAMNDEDDPVPSTSLLWAGYGKGTYTYCSLALYRQLKVFNEGALKLFMNMIAEQLNYDGGKRD